MFKITKFHQAVWSLFHIFLVIAYMYVKISSIMPVGITPDLTSFLAIVVNIRSSVVKVVAVARVELNL